jgi:ABC-2 type transport system ATP-binding protein
MIGSPAELRERLFAKSLVIRTRASLEDPQDVFGGAPAVDGWHQNGSGEYVVAVSDPEAAAPSITRALVEADADVLSIAESHHSLEDVYLELIDQDAELERRPA